MMTPVWRSLIWKASEALARHLTLSLSGRAKNVAPHLAKAVLMEGVTTLLDVGGGTGLYS